MTKSSVSAVNHAKSDRLLIPFNNFAPQRDECSQNYFISQSEFTIKRIRLRMIL